MDTSQPKGSKARYRQIADDLDQRIVDGEFGSGAFLPSIDDLSTQYGAAPATVREAITVLELRGLVYTMARRGTIVRAAAPEGAHRLQRGHQVWRNDLGYIFNASAGHWPPLRTPTVTWEDCPERVAALLDIAPGSRVLVRDRVIGSADTREPLQLATSYLPADVAAGTVLAEGDTGPGGIYDRLEHDMNHGPLEWEETVGARLPTAKEAAELRIPASTPLLVFTRTATSGTTGRVLEVNITRVSGDRFEVTRPIERDPATAAWPTTVATGANRPQTRKGR